MSKTKKITANKKKRRENGMRALPSGSKPHSKGEAFSRSRDERWDRIRETVKTRIANTAARAILREEINISSEVRVTFFGLKAQRWSLAL